MTHSALQLAPDSGRFKFEVPSILTAILLDSKPAPSVLRSRQSNGCICIEKRAGPFVSDLFISQFMKYVSFACQRFYRKSNSVCAPVLPVMSKNFSFCGPLRLYILKKPGCRLESRMTDDQHSKKDEKLGFHSAVLSQSHRDLKL